MRLVTADPVPRPVLRRAPLRGGVRARIETLGLAATTAVCLFGLGLAARQQSAELRGAAVMDVNDPAAALTAPLAAVFSEPAERDWVAQAVRAHLVQHGPLTHVGALASIRVPAAEVRGNPRLAVLNARLAKNPAAATIPILPAADVAVLKPALSVRASAEYERAVRLAMIEFLLVFWGAHLARRVTGRIGDPIVLPAVQLLTGLGAVAMIALRDPVRDTMAIAAFVHGVSLGVLGLTLVSAVDFEHPRLRRGALVPFAAAVSLAVALVLFGSGPGESGVKVNLLGTQPIEAIRLLAVFALAAYFGRRWELLRELSSVHGPTAGVRRRLRLPRRRDLQPLAIMLLTLFALFFAQRDLGPALVLGCMALGLYGVARGRAALVLLGFACLGIGLTAANWMGVPATLARRVAIWLDPWENGRTGGDQVAHALWAAASGGLRGAGPGAGDGDLVPAGQTDLILAVVSEELGAGGLIVIATLFALLLWRLLRTARRASGEYTSFLVLGCALSIAVPPVVIAGGQLGLLPLSGVATPFLTFGKSSMIVNFLAIGIVLAVAARGRGARRPFEPQIRALALTLAVAAGVILGRGLWVQVVAADAVAVRPTVVRDADGAVRYRYNPRLLAAARTMPRGTVYDRSGVAMATSDAAVAADARHRLRGVPAQWLEECRAAGGRCYPLGGAAFHLLGDFDHETNWGAPNTSFVERDANATLQGFDDRARVVQVGSGAGRVSTTVERDYTDLLPLLRHRRDPSHPAVRAIVERRRDVQLTLDAALQAHVAHALATRASAAGAPAGAVVVVDVKTGGVLASASYPWPRLSAEAEGTDMTRAALLDRARYGLYPPGSTFKLIAAAAALAASGSSPAPAFVCDRLPDGRVGARVRGVPRPVRDDPTDREPHGRIGLRQALVVSCNAYFAQLAVQLGPEALRAAAAPPQIQVSSTPARLRGTLAHAGYGQGEVLASPLRMARAVAAIAGSGAIRDAPLVTAGGAPRAGTPWLRAADAAFLRGAMREAVTSGTGRSLSGHAVAIAGKTGTAEVQNAASHAWFVGFAPAAAPSIAFAVVVEHAGYGGRVAAPLAGDVVTAARLTGVLR